MNPSQQEFLLDSSMFKSEPKNIKISKKGYPLNYHSVLGNRWQHCQDMIAIGSQNGYMHYMGTWSQNCNNDEGGLVFVARVAEGSESGEVIWCEDLSNTHASGGFNHPGDLRILGNVVVIAGQNWNGGDFGWFSNTFGDKMAQGNGGQAVLFYDISDFSSPAYKGKLNSFVHDGKTQSIIKDVDTISCGLIDGVYYLGFNGNAEGMIWCTAESFSPDAKWKYAFPGNTGSASPVKYEVNLDNGDVQHFVGGAVWNGKKQMIEFQNWNDFSNGKFKFDRVASIECSAKPFSDGGTFSLSQLSNGVVEAVFLDVESDGKIHIKSVKGVSSL